MNDTVRQQDLTAETDLVVKEVTGDADTKLGRLAGDFLDGLEGSPETARVYASAIAHFLSWRSRNQAHLTEQTMTSYKKHLADSGFRPCSSSTYFTAVRLFLKYLVTKGVLPDNPAEGVKSPKVPKTHLRDALTKKEARTLLKSIPRGSLKGSRDYAMINVMIRTAVREIEVSRAVVGDIEKKDGGHVLYVHGKGRDSKDEFVVLTEESLGPINKYLSQRGTLSPDDPLFGKVGTVREGHLCTRAVRKIVTYYLRGAGLKSKRVTPHSLRHTGITLAITAGKGRNLLQVQQMARHRNMSTTLRYFHEYDRMKNAAEHCIKI